MMNKVYYAFVPGPDEACAPLCYCATKELAQSVASLYLHGAVGEAHLWVQQPPTSITFAVVVRHLRDDNKYVVMNAFPAQLRDVWASGNSLMDRGNGVVYVEALTAEEAKQLVEHGFNDKS